MKITKNRKKAIEILERIAEYLSVNNLADETIFDCDEEKGTTTWYDIEDLIVNILKK